MNTDDQVRIVENPEDPATAMAIGTTEGQNAQVVIEFQAPIRQFKMQPVNAAYIGRHLIDCAVALGARVEIKVPKVKLTPEQHAALIVRVEHILRDLAARGRRHDYIARELVDQVLARLD